MHVRSYQATCYKRNMWEGIEGSWKAKDEGGMELIWRVREEMRWGKGMGGMRN